LQVKGASFSETAEGKSGGGFSTLYKQPLYQQTLPNNTQKQFNNHRGVPDVAASEDPHAGLAVYLLGKWQIASGKSEVAVWAAIAAIANQMAGHPLGFLNPGLYKLAASRTYHQDFRDVTKGNNGNGRVKGYGAAAGWDPVTGLGTPNAEKLIPDLIATLK
jgi:subtilase family serine protease